MAENQEQQEEQEGEEQTSKPVVDLEAIKLQIEELTAQKVGASKLVQRRLRAKIRELKKEAGIPLPPRKVREKAKRPNKTEQLTRLREQVSEVKQELEELLGAKSPITKSQIKDILAKFH